MEESLHATEFLHPAGKNVHKSTKAAIAIQFEQCTKSLERFSLLLSPYFPEITITDRHGQLLAWGHQTGASNRVLDWKLRKAHDMHDIVLGLLTDLQAILQEGIHVLERGSVQDTKLTLKKEQNEVFPSPIGPDEEVSGNSGPLSPGPFNLLQQASNIVDAVNVIMSNLVKLGPSLSRPYPQDLDHFLSNLSNGGDNDKQNDIKIARQMFPRASRTLQFRLGCANWKRRILQKPTQEPVQLSAKVLRKWEPREPKRTIREELAQDVFHFQTPTLQNINNTRTTAPFLPPISTASSRAPSEMGESSVALSLWDTVSEPPRLRRIPSTVTFATSISNTTFSTTPKPSPGAVRAQILNVSIPDAPVILDDLDEGHKQLFTCNLCGYDLEAGGKIKTEEDWRHHVYEDLEAYVCTFDECFSAQEMYATRDEWYKHELESHRIATVWACSACSHEFRSKQLAKGHVETHANEFDEDAIFMMKTMLRRTLSSEALEGGSCPLCQTNIEPEVTKDHIAMHLEEFALLSIKNDAFIDEENDEFFSRTNDATVSEKRSKKAIVDRFVKEQLKLRLEEEGHPIETYMDPESSVNALDDMSDYDGSEDSDSLVTTLNDKAMDERAIKEAVLNHFVTEQLKLNVESGKQPPDKYIVSGSGIDLLDDMSDYAGSKDSESRASGKRGDSQKMLIQRMLEGQRDDLDDIGQVNPRDSPRPPVGVGGTPSLASSTERLPFLRTWSAPRNEDFMGREKELASLYKILSEPGRVCIISAEGGMGKTALAVEYSWRYEHCYHYVFWVQAETPVGSSDTFCQIALQLHLAPEGTEKDVLITLGREFLEKTQDKRWLIVFDNVEKWDDIDIYTPTKTSATTGSILITTRHESLTAPSRPINYFRIVLQELDIDEGRKLLIYHLPVELRPEENSLRDPEYKIAGELAALAGLPLLITYIAGYVRASGCSLAEFWEYWDAWRPKARTVESQDRNTSVFHLALRDLSPDARKVLEIMAFLDSYGIQKELLMRNDTNKPGPAYLKPARFKVIMSNLLGQGFVEEKNKRGDCDIYSVHRILQARLLQDLNAKPQKRDEIFHQAFDLVRFHLPRPSLDTPEPWNWNAFKEYLPHVLSLQRAYADPLSITTPTPFVGLAELFKDGGVLLWQRYIHIDALKLLNSAERILDELETEEESLRAEINITINLLLQYSGISKRKESKERLTRILDYRKRLVKKKASQDVTRDDEILLNNAHADYANALLQFNDYKTAEPIYQICYTKYIELGTDIDPVDAFAIAKLQHHMAYCKMYRQDFKKAIELAEKAVDIIEQLGDRQITLRYQFDLACIVLQSGDKERALALHREILEARLGFQGKASYFSLQSQYAYAAMCHYVGRLNEAERWMRQALVKAGERGGKNFWPDAAVARTKYHLSQVLRERAPGQANSEADELAREAKDILSKMLPYDPEPIVGVKEEDTGALFDHLQPVFGGRFTGVALLKYVS